MSGPKVVRIITREELIAICEGQLAQLREAAAQWERAGRRNDLLTTEAIERTCQNVKELGVLLMKERFLELQKRVPVEIEFLKNDMSRRIEQAAKTAADARMRRRRLATMARQKIDEAQASGRPLPQALHRELEAAANGTGDVQRAELL